MRQFLRTTLVAATAAAAAAFAGAALHAAGDDDGDAAEAQKIAKDALDKAVARGKDLFHGKDGVKKSCASCHESAEKPKLDLTTRDYSYPKFSVKAKRVLSLGQKINEMYVSKSGAAKEMDLAGADIVALEAYVASLKKK